MQRRGNGVMRSRRGFSLVAVIAIGLILTAIALALITRSSTTTSLIGRSRESMQADNLIDAAIARGRARITDAFSTFNAKNNLVPLSNNAVTGIPSLMIAAAALNTDETFVPVAGGLPYYQFAVDEDNNPATPVRQVRYTIVELSPWDPNNVAAANPENPFNSGCSGTPVPANNWCSIASSNGLFVVKTFRIIAALVDDQNKPWAAAESYLTVSRDSNFNKFALYNDDMEVAPGGGFTIRGQMHSNTNIYINSSQNNGLVLKHLYDYGSPKFNADDSFISAVGNIFQGRKVGSTAAYTVGVEKSDGTIASLSQANDSVRPLNSNFKAEDLNNPLLHNGINNPPTDPADTWEVDPNWAGNAQNTFDRRLASGHSAVNMPDASDINPADTNNKFATLVNSPAPATDPTGSGGLYVETRTDNSTLIKKDGVPIAVISGGQEYAVAADGVSQGTLRSAAQRYFPADTFKESSFYNGREGASTNQRNVSVTDIDVAKLGQAKFKDLNGNVTGEIYPPSGLVYAVRADAVADTNAPGSQATSSSRKPNGFRLKNGAALPGNGLNFVTGNPAYVQGDYNVHSSDPAAANYNAAADTWKNSMIVSDALTVLSNAWSDAQNADAARSVRAAADTEVNGVLISGITKSYSGDYNGGLENFPRLLEDWGSLDSANASSLKIRGSFLQGYYSRYGTGRWSGGPTYYGNPVNRNVNGQPVIGRNWGFDVKFLTSVSPAARYFVTGTTYIGSLGATTRYTLTNRLSSTQYLQRSACATYQGRPNQQLGWEPGACPP